VVVSLTRDAVGSWSPYPLVLDGGAVLAKDELLRSGRELWETGDGKILMVEIGVFAEDIVGLEQYLISACCTQSSLGRSTHLPDYRQDPRLRIVISVGANA
jgi:hypothetical protein